MARSSWEAWRRVFERSASRVPYLHLERASQKGLCFCDCPRALVAVPDQLDCPWCGCGWLFSCAQCGSAFTFAKAVKIDYPLDEIVAMDLSGRGFSEDAEYAKGATEFMREALSDIDEDRTYVYLDGSFLTLDALDIKFEGWHARHNFPVIPHKLELTTPGELARVLGDGAYWSDRKREE